MSKKTCFTCHWATVPSTELFDKVCLRCKKYDRWQTKVNSPHPPEEFTMNWIQPCVYEALVRMYDRYAEVVLTAPIKEGSPDIMNMDQFFNPVLVRGLISYGEFLMPMEKELGII